MNTQGAVELLAAIAEGQDELKIEKGILRVILGRLLFGEAGPTDEKKSDETLAYLVEHHLQDSGNVFVVRIDTLAQIDDREVDRENVCYWLQQSIGFQGLERHENRSLVKAACELFDRTGKQSDWSRKAQEILSKKE